MAKIPRVATAAARVDKTSDHAPLGIEIEV